MNKCLGLFTSICAPAGHLETFHTATGALGSHGACDQTWTPLPGQQAAPDPHPSKHCSRKPAAGSHLDNMLQLDDVACMPQAHRLAPCQALIAWLWLLEVGRWRNNKRLQGSGRYKRLLPPLCLAEVGLRRDDGPSGLSLEANQTLHPTPNSPL